VATAALQPDRVAGKLVSEPEVRSVVLIDCYRASMTLHLYGATADKVVSISDRRTTEVKNGTRSLVSDHTIKYLKVDVPTAIVLVQGRSSFTYEGMEDTARDLLRQAMASAPTAISGVEDLGQFLWDVVQKRWYSCEDCREQRQFKIDENPDDEEFIFLDPEGEYACERHEFMLVVLGFDAVPGGGPRVYRRDWGQCDQITSGPLPYDRFYSTVSSKEGNVELIGELPLNPDQIGGGGPTSDWLFGKFMEVKSIVDKEQAKKGEGPLSTIGGTATLLERTAADSDATREWFIPQFGPV
jgi:hypothetical protein